MRNGKADFEAMNRAAGNGLREMRQNRDMSFEELARCLGMTSDGLRQREEGRIPMEAAILYYAEMLLQAGGFGFYFHPYNCVESCANPMHNVIPFPNLTTIAGVVDQGI